jgi:threonine synthase
LGDKVLNEKFLITSANSINIARLIPQSFYYFHAAAQLNQSRHPLVFSVPSGNFGNLTAGLLASAMGLKVDRFVAATNANDVVPQYTRTSLYSPRPSVQTISNAMDVGNPSNFDRMLDLFGSNHEKFCSDIFACAFTDEQTIEAIHQVLAQRDYLMDPHGAVAWLGAQQFLKTTHGQTHTIFLETAHPAKFPETLKIVMEKYNELPPQLKMVSEKPEKFHSLNNDFEELMGFLMEC